MPKTRRETLALGLAGATGLVVPGKGFAAPKESEPARCFSGSPRSTSPWRAAIEGQRRADMGNGYYLNPILSGDRPDPSILKDGDEYYATFSSFLYYPAVVVWHSRDLVNWTPMGPALEKPLGSVWALDIAKHDGRYFIYIPIFNAEAPEFSGSGIPCRIFVVHAPSTRGPWSEPVDMDIKGYIDPGHAVGEDGKRYLFLNGGARVRISDDGLRREGPRAGLWRVADPAGVADRGPGARRPEAAPQGRLVLHVFRRGRDGGATDQPHGGSRPFAFDPRPLGELPAQSDRANQQPARAVVVARPRNPGAGAGRAVVARLSRL
jgi:hypothetical protein